jgi:1,2-phenylacetyl-CoA epoxidase PaaB subunit
MATFEVFGRRKWDAPLEHVGTSTPRRATAMLLARETHFRHNEGVDFAVVPVGATFHRLDDPSLLSARST